MKTMILGLRADRAYEKKLQAAMKANPKASKRPRSRRRTHRETIEFERARFARRERWRNRIHGDPGYCTVYNQNREKARRLRQ